MEVYYYTDPACPWSWALEPALRKLLVALGDGARITYVMAGMAKEFGEPLSVVEEALDASASSGMPVDARLWLHDPPRSSFPACMAVKAAAEQGDPGPYLRRLREGFLCRRRKLDSSDVLLEEARATEQLDLERFRIALGSHAILEAFGADLERAKQAASRPEAGGGERVPLPSLEFRGANGGLHGVYGNSSYDELRDAAVAAGAGPLEESPLAVGEALRRFGTLATAEVAVLCELPGPRAPAELWRLASEWQLKAERLGSDELWSLA